MNHIWNEETGICKVSGCGEHFYNTDGNKLSTGNATDTKKLRLYWITKDKTQIKAYPGAKGKVIATYGKNKCVRSYGTIKNENKIWYKVQYKSQGIGYIETGSVSAYTPTKENSQVRIGSNMSVSGRTLKGTISSNFALKQYKVFVNGKEIYCGNTGALAATRVSSTTLQGQTKMQEVFSKKVKSLKTYTVKVKLWDWSGKSDEKTITVGETEKTALAKPEFADPPKAITNGYEVTVKQSKGATLHYTVGGGSEQKATGETVTIKPAITAEGKTTITAWSTQSGYKDSGKATKTIEVTKASTPYVDDRQDGDHVNVVLKGNTGASISWRKGSSGAFSSYDGNVIVLKDGETISFYAEEKGHRASPTDTYTAEVTEPGTPEIKVIGTGKDIPAGKSMTVGWAPDRKASSYTASLYDANNRKVDEITTEKTTATFTVDEAGDYSIGVAAVNAVGESGESSRAEFTVHDALTVVFKDGEGEDAQILNKIRVEYGEKAGPVQTPSRNGYEFSGWKNAATGNISVNEYQTATVREDTTYTAVFSKKSYTVRLYNSAGKKIDTQKVGYGEAVDTDSLKETVEADLGTGNVLTGWQVIKTSDGESRADINAVDSDMDVQAVVSWENKDLPVAVKVESAELDSDGKSVTADIRLSTDESRDLKFYVIAALKAVDTDDENLEKTVFADRRIVYLNAGSRNEKFTNITFQLMAGKTSELTKVEVAAVQCNEDMSTGGAYSLSDEKEIEIPAESVSWGDWTAWSTDEVEKTDTNEVETATQYRSRTKEYVYSGYDTLDGYTKLSTETLSTTYGNWRASSPTASTNTDSSGKTVITAESMKAKCWVANYCDCGKVCWRNTGGTCKYCGGKTSNTLVVYTPASFPDPERDASDDSYIFNKTITANQNGDYRIIYLKGKSVSSYTTKAVTGKIYLWKASENFQRNIYRPKTVKTRNKFWKWGEWSDWSETETAKTSERDVETQQVYRSREQLTETTHESASVKVTLDPDGSRRKTISGELKDAGITEDLSGRNATVMVYQTNNEDPNKYQLCHIGHTVISDGNSYTFSFVPVREPNADTGSYVVSLAIEGLSGLVRVATIDAPEKTYTVTLEYIGEDGNTVQKTQTVAEHGDVDLSSIEIPERPGYLFTSWNNPTTNITETSPKVIRAEYMAIPNTVVFVDWVRQTVELQKAETGTKITVPGAADAPEGYVFRGWKQENGTIVDPDAADGKNTIEVTGDMVVTAEYEVTKHTVTFLDADGGVLETQEVEHGKAAVPPVYAAPEGKGEFAGWGMKESWWNVENDVTVHPILLHEETAAAPTSYVDMDEDTEELSMVLDTDEDGASIYYTTDGTYPTVDMVQEYLSEGTGYRGVIQKYTEPIKLEASLDENGEVTADDHAAANILAVSYVDGKNLSNIHAALLTDDEETREAEELSYADWKEIGEYEVKTVAGKDVHVLVEIEDNPGITGYDVLVESEAGIFSTDSDEYGKPVIEDSIAASDGTVNTSEEGNGWRVSWTGVSPYEQNGNLFELVLHVDDGTEAGTYPVTVSYLPDGTLDYEYDPMELEGLKAKVSSDACIDLNTLDVKLSRTSFAYEGTEIKPAVIIEGLKEGTDYKVEYLDNINAGTAKAVITGMDNYAGTVEKEFMITQANIANADVAAIADAYRTGEAIEPEVEVSFNGTALEKGKDYEVTYRDNVEVGTATATIRGIGNFRGTTEAKFNITETAESRLAETEKRLEESEKSRQDAETRASELQTAKDDAEKARADAEARAAELQAAKEDAEKASAEAEAAKAQAEEDLAAAVKAKEEADLRAEEAQDKLTQAEADLEAVNAEKTAAEADAAANEQALAEADQKVADAEAARAAAEAELKEANDAKAAAETQLAEAEAAKSDAEKQLAEAEAAKADAEKRAEAAEKELAELKASGTDDGTETKPEDTDSKDVPLKVKALWASQHSVGKVKFKWTQVEKTNVTGWNLKYRMRKIGAGGKWSGWKTGTYPANTFEAWINIPKNYVIEIHAQAAGDRTWSTGIITTPAGGKYQAMKTTYVRDVAANRLLSGDTIRLRTGETLRVRPDYEYSIKNYKKRPRLYPTQMLYDVADKSVISITKPDGSKYSGGMIDGVATIRAEKAGETQIIFRAPNGRTQVFNIVVD